MPIFSQAISSSLPKNYVNMPEGSVTNVMASGMKYGADPAQKVISTIVNINKVSDNTAQALGPNFDRFSVLSDPSKFNVRGNYFGVIQDVLPISSITSTFGNNFVTDELSQINPSNLLRDPKSEVKTLANNLYASTANEAKQTFKSAARSVVQDVKDLARGAVNSFLSPEAAKTTNLGVTDSRLSYTYFGPITAHKSYTQGKAKDGNTPIYFKGVEPLMNPYYVFRLNLVANKNSAGEDSELQSKLLLDKEFRDGLNSFNKKEVTLTNILAKYGNFSQSNPTPYRASDFLWLKYYNKIPLNRQITLRRYMFPINDDRQRSPYFSKKSSIQGWSNNPVAQMVTFFGGPSGNSLSRILSINPSTSVQAKDSQLQYINLFGGKSTDALSLFKDSSIGKFASEKASQLSNAAGSLTNLVSFGGASLAASLMKGALSGLSAKDLTKGLLSFSGLVDPARAGGLESYRDTYNPYDRGGYLQDIYQKPFNVISSVNERTPGLTGGIGTDGISLVFDYTLKSIGHLNSKAVMLDIMANILATCHYRGNFWGGEARFFLDKGIFPLLDEGQTLKLVQGFWSGDFKSATEALKNILVESFGKDTTFQQIIDLVNAHVSANQETPSSSAETKALYPGSVDISQSTANTGYLQTTLDKLEDYALYDLLSGMFGLSAGSSNASLPVFQAFRTGAPTGEWHITVGNPFNPIAKMGNLICTGVRIEFNDNLGADDFPTEMRATVSLKPGMPRANADIESVFNDGHGGLYIPKADSNNLPSIEELQETKARETNDQGIENSMNAKPNQMVTLKAQNQEGLNQSISPVSPHISRPKQNDPAKSPTGGANKNQDASTSANDNFNQAKEAAKATINQMKSNNFGIGNNFLG